MLMRVLLIAALIPLCSSCSRAAVDPARVTNLRCEYLNDPIGIDQTEPRLSWMIESDKRGAMQTAYQILVASSPEILAKDTGDLWDSGKIGSSQSTQVIYSGQQLTSRMACYWKARVWTSPVVDPQKDALPSAWSPVARWSMGLLGDGDWQAKWITLGQAIEAESRAYPALDKVRWIWSGPPIIGANAMVGPAANVAAGTTYFRRSINIPKGRAVESASLVVYADDVFTIWINGTLAFSREKLAAPTVLQLGKAFSPGSNTLAIKVVNGSDKAAGSGLICKLMIAMDNGATINIPSDGSWRVSTREIADWYGTTLDDSAWPKARLTGFFGGEDQSRSWELPRPLTAARYFRHEFVADRNIKRAVASVSGLGLFELHINGQKIGNAVLEPEVTQYDARAAYVTYDVTSQVHKGTNAVGAIVGLGRFTGTQLRLQVDLQYEDGSTGQWMSNEQWKATARGPIRQNSEYDGESYDARMELGGWDQPKYNESSWSPVSLMGASINVMSAQMIAPIRVTATIKPVGLTNPQPGVWVFDMGQNMVGWCRLNVSGPAGTRIRLRHAETLRADGLLYTTNLRGARATDFYTLKGKGAESWEPKFTYHGFRFVELTGLARKPDLSTLEGRVVNDDVAQASSFECSNNLLNQIHHNIFWGTRGNYRSMPTDCPQRDERQGWLGDRAGECKGEADLFDIAALYRKWLGDIRDAQKPSGSVPDVAPQGWVVSTDGVVWPSAYVMAANMLLEQYGDTKTIESHYNALKRWIDFTTANTMKDGIATKNQYGDWCVPPESPELVHSVDPKRQTDGKLLSTAYFYEDLRLMQRFATLMDRDDDAKSFGKQADVVLAAFNRTFFDPNTDQYSNGSQTSSVLPLAFGMVPADHKAAVFKNLVDKIQNQSDGHIGTGLVGGQWLMRVLSDNGRTDLAYSIATQKTYPSWGYMVSKGATTIWELWNGDTADPSMNSGNHVMLVGDLNIWMHEYLLGIASDPASPGFAHFMVQPHPVGDLTFARGYYDSTHGRISVDWKRKDNAFTLNLMIPANTTATLRLPADDAATVTESGHPAQGEAGITFKQMDGGTAVFEIGAGTYAFESRLPAAN
ncbi:MAG: glycoside hydrolase family 78 protein [Planctomycetota bacterium]|nr:glycoside hydrolase family 78 protein [Planctomycetota bacterium]